MILDDKCYPAVLVYECVYTVYSECCICMYRISGGLFIHAEFNTADPYTWLVSLEILFISWIISQNPTRYDTKLSLLLLEKFNRRFLCQESEKQNGRKCVFLNYFVPSKPGFVNTFFFKSYFEFEKVSDCEYCAYVGGITQYEESVCFHTPLLPSPLNMEIYILNSYKILIK